MSVESIIIAVIAGAIPTVGTIATAVLSRHSRARRRADTRHVDVEALTVTVTSLSDHLDRQRKLEQGLRDELDRMQTDVAELRADLTAERDVSDRLRAQVTALEQRMGEMRRLLSELGHEVDDHDPRNA